MSPINFAGIISKIVSNLMDYALSSECLPHTALSICACSAMKTKQKKKQTHTHTNYCCNQAMPLPVENKKLLS